MKLLVQEFRRVDCSAIVFVRAVIPPQLSGDDQMSTLVNQDERYCLLVAR